MNTVECIDVQSIVPSDGIWLLQLTEILLSIGISLFLVYFIPWIAILFVTIWGAKFFSTIRSKVIASIPIIWISIWAMNILPCLLILPVLFEVRKISNRITFAIRGRL